jgi:RNA polymerase sigma-70 factor (ECF subfamily)
LGAENAGEAPLKASEKQTAARSSVSSEISAGEEERLAIAAAQQDSARFAELYEANFDRVYGYIARRVRDRSVAEDLTSDVFHQALANLTRFEWRGVPFAAWLFRIAANAIADRGKRLAKESEILTATQHQISGSDGSNTFDLEEAERRALLFQCVDTLPTNQRRVIVRRFAEEKSIREIANEMGRTEGAVKQLQFRALENLRVKLEPKSGEIDG